MSLGFTQPQTPLGTPPASLPNGYVGNPSAGSAGVVSPPLPQAGSDLITSSSQLPTTYNNTTTGLPISGQPIASDNVMGPSGLLGFAPGAVADPNLVVTPGPQVPTPPPPPAGLQPLYSSGPGIGLGSHADFLSSGSASGHHTDSDILQMLSAGGGAGSSDGISGEHGQNAVGFADRIFTSMTAKELEAAQYASGAGQSALNAEKKTNQQLYTQANKIEDAIRKQALNVHTDQTVSADSGHLQNDQAKLQAEITQFEQAAGPDPNAQALAEKAITAGLLDVRIDAAYGVQNAGGQNRFFVNGGDSDGMLDPTSMSLGVLAKNSFQIGGNGGPSLGQVEGYITKHDAKDASGTGTADNLPESTRYYEGFAQTMGYGSPSSSTSYSKTA